MDAPKEKNETKNFYIFLVMALVLAGLLMVFILLENLLVLPQIVIQLFAAVTILIIFLPLLIVIRSEIQKSDDVVPADQFNDTISDQGKSKIELESCCKNNNSVSVEIPALVTDSKSAESSNEVLGAHDEKKLKGKWPQRVWMIITIAIVFEYTVGATFSRGFNRALGSIAAGVLALSIAQLALSARTVAQPVIIGFNIFVVGVRTSFMKLWPSLTEYEYSFRVVLFTFSLIIVSAYRLRNHVRTTVDRLYSISIGGAVTMAVCATIFPCWAREQLHKQVVKNFERVADFLEECVKKYFQDNAVMDDYEGQPAFQRCKSALESSSTEQMMASSAKWEPPHGRFRHFC